MVVVALDEPTATHVRGLGVATYVRSSLRSRTGSTDNHATSGLKFAVLRDFIAAGCSVLLSDVDVVWLQNPFTLPSLYRDVDVEGMTDGWDDPTAYGYEWGGHGMLRLSARNSGLFYVRATHETLAMMGRLKGRMEREAVWDQTAYNEEMWWAALPTQPSVGVSARVMNYFCNMNSKTMFRFMLDDPQLMTKHRPVSIHVNYHPEKLCATARRDHHRLASLNHTRCNMLRSDPGAVGVLYCPTSIQRPIQRQLGQSSMLPVTSAARQLLHQVGHVGRALPHGLDSSRGKVLAHNT